jgi:putative phosphoribosyl transferase
VISEMFKDRTEVGKSLAEKIRGMNLKKPIVLAIPRGGVPVAKEIALAIRAPLDLVITRKIGYPGQPEFAIGAVTQEGELILDQQTIRSLAVPKEYLKQEAEAQTREIRSRLERYRGKRSFPDFNGKDVIIVDDGIATGNTVLAAIDSVKRKKPASITLAIGVAPRESIHKLSDKVDSIVCLDMPEPFYAIGEFYESFEQVEDDEVKQIISEVNSGLRQRATTKKASK